jgi:Spy/CpxP family protein refolding chaperone
MKKHSTAWYACGDLFDDRPQYSGKYFVLQRFRGRNTETFQTAQASRQQDLLSLMSCAGKLSGHVREYVMRSAPALVVMMLAITPASAQQHQPYGGMQHRVVKALSDEQIADLRAGRGMGLALAAELNGYPGPLHVLEHADALGLTAEQRARTQSLFDAMKAEAIALGEKLIAEESALDHAFAARSITPQSLVEGTVAIGATRAALRATHLRYHLAQVQVLTPEQVRRYAELRGYAAGHGAHAPGHHPRRHHGN